MIIWLFVPREEKSQIDPSPKKFNLRIPPELHAKLSIAAHLHGESLNNYIAKMLLRLVA